MNEKKTKTLREEFKRPDVPVWLYYTVLGSVCAPPAMEGSSVTARNSATATLQAPVAAFALVR